MGLFGTNADFLADINLILQFLTLSLLTFGYLKRRLFKNHGYIMTTVLLLTIGTTFLVMGPRLLPTYSFYGSRIVIHAFLGLGSMLFGGVFSYRFITAIQNNKPLMCGTKKKMRLALILWVISIIGGIMVYVNLYI